MLPGTRLRRVTQPDRLAEQIADLPARHEPDEEFVRDVAATMLHSLPVNLYSGLLGRQGVYKPDQPDDRTREAPADDRDRLAPAHQRSEACAPS
jgi:hypothetical protein